MTILHFSDTHLGFQAFDIVNDEGVNAREQDVYFAFERVIHEILTKKPDLVIHSGDFFHRPSPSNRALTFGLEQLNRVSKAGIPVALIAGNHETPKTIYNSPILRALRSVDGVFPICSDEWESFSVGDVVGHGVPHINNPARLNSELARMEPVSGKFNILMLHTSLGRSYLMEEYGEQMFPEDFESKLAGFQYVALGHWHGRQKINLHPNAWYSGSTERFSDAEIDTVKGYLWLQVGQDLSCTVESHDIPTRPWLKWERSRCHEYSVSQLEAELTDFARNNDTRDAIVSINFVDILTEQSLELTNLKLRELFPDAFQILPKRKSWHLHTFIQEIDTGSFDRLDQIFSDYLKSKYPDTPETASRLTELSKKYFPEF
jgi:DNA repair exonuclease SbcCD nuclease subunit